MLTSPKNYLFFFKFYLACPDPVDCISFSFIAEKYSKKKIDHSHLFPREFSHFHINDRLSDVVLILGEERLSVHRDVLASRSQYFSALFYGGLIESNQPVIQLRNAPLASFKILLEYIYTSRINLSILKDEVILDLLHFSDLYDFSNLRLSLFEYFRSNIHVHSVCLLFDLARFHQHKEIVDESFNFIENHALDVLQSDDFLSLSSDALQEILIRDSFYAKELDIFRAICRWIKNNQYYLDPDTKMEVLSTVRYPLMSDEELSEVRETQLVNLDTISDAIKLRNTWSSDKLQFRGQLKPNVNLISGFPCFLAFNEIDGGSVAKLDHPSIINYIEVVFYEDLGDISYYIEVSMDRHDWVRVIDYSNYICCKFQHLWINQRPVWYIRIVGNKNINNGNCQLIEVSYNTVERHLVEIENGLVAPKYNVALWYMSACIIKSENSWSNSLLNGDHTNYNTPNGYTYHKIGGSGCIVVQLPQPFMLSSMRMRLWDQDNQFYTYTIEVSVNNQDWEMIIDKSKESTRSWQVLQFKPRPIVFIRITGVYSTAGDEFRCVYLETPAQITLDPTSLKTFVR